LGIERQQKANYPAQPKVGTILVNFESHVTKKMPLEKKMIGMESCILQRNTSVVGFKKKIFSDHHPILLWLDLRCVKSSSGIESGKKW
jgi:hypothetical protein